MNKNAQGTIEYLVILAVVVVIGLVVVSLLTNQTNTKQITNTTDKIDAQTRGGITVTEGYTDSLNENVLVVRNNDANPLTLKTISDGTNTKTYNTNIPPTSENTIKLNEIDELTCTCDAGQTTKTCEYTITYESENEIEYTINQSVTVECVAKINNNNNVIEPLPSLTINLEGNGTITGYGDYVVGTTVNISAIPESGYHFVKWTGSDEIKKPYSSQTTIVLNESTIITANFVDSASLWYEVDGIIYCENASVGDTHEFESKTYTKKTIGEINASNASTTCTSGITNMADLFSISNFNDDISHWDTSSVEYMEGMFYNNSSFNQDISGWNTSNVEHMGLMFSYADNFNQDISDWNTSNVKYMNGMFYNNSSFNQDISDWDTSNVEYMNGMFYNNSSFNQDLSDWDVTAVGNNCNSFDSGAHAWADINKPSNIDPSCLS
jgi:surface protein